MYVDVSCCGLSYKEAQAVILILCTTSVAMYGSILFEGGCGPLRWGG